MSQVRCPFCHEYVDKADFAAHKEVHTRLLPDAQQADYVTLPEEEREHGDLDDIPRIYMHVKCGAATGMPKRSFAAISRIPISIPTLPSAPDAKSTCLSVNASGPRRERICNRTKTNSDGRSLS